MRNTNKSHSEPLSVLAKIIAPYLEDPTMAADYKPPQWTTEDEWIVKKRSNVRRIEDLLARNGLSYRMGGIITDGGMAPSKTLSELIRGRDFPSIHREFDRALESVQAKPREAVSAAANILESIFKTYIEDNGLTMPDKLDL